jgi:hypothetical protein
MFLICISEAFRSNLSWDTVYPEYSPGLPLALYINSGTVLLIRHQSLASQ